MTSRGPLRRHPVNLFVMEDRFVACAIGKKQHTQSDSSGRISVRYGSASATSSPGI